MLLQDTTISHAHPKSFLLPNLRYLTRSKLWKKNSRDLFYRNNNKLTLTPEGEKFYQNAEELLAHADAVRSELHELRKQITPVRIGIPPMLGTIYLPDMYLSLKEEFPDVDFRLYEYGSIKACELVLEEKLDLAIGQCRTVCD